jgi:hypothetical protein
MATDRLVVTTSIRFGLDAGARSRAGQLSGFTVGAQTDARPRDQTAHRVLVELHEVADLGVGVAAELAHQQRRPLLLGQLTDSVHHHRELSFAGRRPGRDLRQLAVDRQQPKLAPASGVDRSVARDSDQPRPQLCRNVVPQRD